MKLSKILTSLTSALAELQSKTFVDRSLQSRETAVLEAAEFVGADTTPAIASRIKAIAFYLPQFHPIPENDQWWGKGFTEWTNVSRALPQFEGHYQPHLPGELGFYDLRVPEVQWRQVELAKLYGLHGFCYYYYWFSGKRMLTLPIDRHLNDKGMEFPFCICWANENWTRRWDGLESDVLVAQRYERDDPQRFLEDISPYLADERYIRIEGRPLVLIYRVDQIPEIERVVDIWRTRSKAAGLGNPYLVAVRSFGISDPRAFGFDAAVEFPPHQVSARPPARLPRLLNANYKGQLYTYDSVIPSQVEWPDYRMFRTVMPSWDNEARRPARGHSFIGAGPLKYMEWLQRVCDATDSNGCSEDEKVVFINAWNEWAEGAHLEPDRRYGYAYLKATRDVLNRFPRTIHQRLKLTQAYRKTVSDVAIVIWLFYEELWAEIAMAVEHAGPCDVYLLAPPWVNESTVASVLDRFPHAQIFPFANRGRDVGPFLELSQCVDLTRHKYICKIHSKKSLYLKDGDLWRRDMIMKLLGSHETTHNIMQLFERNKELGVVGPAGYLLSSETHMGSNEQRLHELAKRMGLPDLPKPFSFFAGSMFWFRPQALIPLWKLGLRSIDFEPEKGQMDGTLAHAIERVFTISAMHAGMAIAETPGDHTQESTKTTASFFVPSKDFPQT